MRSMTNDKYIHCGSRTGKKAHIAHPGSSVTLCGVWMRASASQMRIPSYAMTSKSECLKCREIADASDRITIE